MDILRLFFDCDEFYRVFEPPLRALFLSDGKRHRHRKSTLSTSEAMTIVILFQASGFRNFKTYYAQHVCMHLRREFPNLISYQRFVELQSEILLPLIPGFEFGPIWIDLQARFLFHALLHHSRHLAIVLYVQAAFAHLRLRFLPMNRLIVYFHRRLAADSQ
jgi:hypothetical protein